MIISSFLISVVLGSTYLSLSVPGIYESLTKNGKIATLRLLFICSLWSRHTFLEMELSVLVRTAKETIHVYQQNTKHLYMSSLVTNAYGPYIYEGLDQNHAMQSGLTRKTSHFTPLNYLLWVLETLHMQGIRFL